MKLKATKLLENIKEVFEAVGRFIVGVLLCVIINVHYKYGELHEDFDEAYEEVDRLITGTLLEVFKL